MFEHRAYMLDISRDRVPTMETLKLIVDILARYRYNQLQLYTEHTFQYEGHEDVWEDSSPMTPREIAVTKGVFARFATNTRASGA